MTSPRAAAEGGFTLVLVVMVMLAAMGFGVAAYAAAGGDVQLTQRNTNAKRAYAGAEAGLAFYLQKLVQDNDYWTKCDQGDPAGTIPRSPVNQPRGNPDLRQWRALPTDPQVEYTIELLPVAPATQCVPGDDKTMLSEDGTLKLRTTGRVGPAGRQVKRSIVTSLRRKGFLDFLYFSDYETSDPLQQELSYPSSLWAGIPLKRAATQADARLASTPSTSVSAWADQTSTCRQYLPARDAVRFSPADPAGKFGWAQYDPDGGGPRVLDWHRTDDNTYGGAGVDIRCSTIRFADADGVLGPFHSNDTIMVCNNPSFGRTDTVDDVEYFAWRPDPNCAGSAPNLGQSQEMTNANGLHVRRTFPDSNNELRASVETGYLFSGKTTIVLQGTQMQVTSGGVTTTKPLPPNGLVYVSDSGAAGACPPLSPRNPYAAGRETCGDAYVSGTYAKNLSIGTQGDVVVNGDVTMSGGNAVLGLIAQNFVRVEHPMAAYPCSGSTANTGGNGTNRRIEAAILSVDHVFTVDNYQCGPKLGTLTVKGAIGQRYRGPVGTGGTGGTGYVKSYQYDQRLKFRSPPFFLAPAEAAWRVLRSTEQVPAT